MKKVINNIGKLIYVWRRDGLKVVLMKLLNHILLVKSYKWNNNIYIELRKKFSLVEKNNFNAMMKSKRLLSKSEKLIINWIIPPFDEVRSGGHKTITRFIKYFEERGYINRIYLFPPPVDFEKSIIRIKKAIKNYFFDLKAELIPWNENNIEFSHISIATEYRTAYPLYFIKNTLLKSYFIQDYEALFFPMSSEYIYAENTYKMGYFAICASNWLYSLMKKEYNLKGGFFNLGIDEREYSNNISLREREDAIIVYSRLVTPRRGFDLLRDALHIVKRKMPDLNIYFFGDDFKKELFPYDIINLGVLPPSELNKYYNKCSIGVVCSLTNYSLIPNEMMKSGLLVIDMDTKAMNVVYGGLKNKPLVLAPPTPFDIANTILYYIEHKSERLRIVKNGLKYTENIKWENSFQKVEQLLLSEFKIK